MKTIKIGKQTLGISPKFQRGLEAVVWADYTLMRSDAWEGRMKYASLMLPLNAPESMYDLGVCEIYRESYHPHSKRVAAFFKRHPRCKSVIEGHPKRINLILKKLQEVA